MASGKHLMAIITVMVLVTAGVLGAVGSYGTIE